MANKRENYYKWMIQMIDPYKDTAKVYSGLLKELDNIPYTYELEMDGNREEDAYDLRRVYFSQNQGSYDFGSPSVLEVMVALARRCEDNIMHDPEWGDRTDEWFWNMVVSLGFSECKGSDIDIQHVDTVVNNMLNRKYPKNGEGSLFYVPHTSYDMRKLQIWDQMNIYLNAFYNTY